MKKSKILLVTVLALVLCMLCVTTSTFSWLPRPKEEKGNALAWNPSSEVSVGKDISMNTYELNEDGSVPDAPPEVSDFSNTGGLASGSRKYYRTDIVNSGTEAQSVSLFLSSLDMGVKDGSFHIGVNSPLRTYKSYPQSSGSVSSGTANQKVSADKMRIYFQQNGLWSGKTCTIYCDGSYYAKLNFIKNDSSGGDTYYVDIPINTQKFYFTFEDSSLSGWQRTKDIYTNDSNEGVSATSSKVYKIKKEVTNDDYRNQVFEYYSINAANLVNTYTSVSLKENENFSLNLVQGTDYVGSNIEYISSDSTVFTVNSSTGVITALKEGSANLTIKITGGTYSDVKEVKIPVTVTKATGLASDAINDVPIVTNVRVEAATGEGDTKKDTVVSIYWYIKNEGSTTLTYTIDDIYLSL